ncbi:uncharacterized protein TNCV_2846241 [Trichonephila clavipes]|nr:uncharacterized protein TNCV_2846241 [Trichonephila clavipes]
MERVGKASPLEVVRMKKIDEHNVFKEKSSPTSYAKRNIENGYAISSGRILIDEPMLRHIKNCTEEEAHRQLGGNEWSTTLDELDAFVSILYAREGEKDFNGNHREEITDFVQKIPGFQECDKEAWMACEAEDCGFQMLNVDEIVNSVQEESDPVDDETDEDEDNNNGTSKSRSNAYAFSALGTTMEWYEPQLLLLNRIGDLAAKKRRCTAKNK